MKYDHEQYIMVHKSINSSNNPTLPLVEFQEKQVEKFLK